MPQSSIRILSIVAAATAIGSLVGLLFPQLSVFVFSLVAFEDWMSPVSYLGVAFVLNLLLFWLLAWAGLRLSRHFHCPDPWAERISTAKRFLLPGGLGLLLGLVSALISSSAGLFYPLAGAPMGALSIFGVSLLTLGCFTQILLILFLLPLLGIVIRVFLLRRSRSHAYWLAAFLLAFCAPLFLRDPADWSFQGMTLQGSFSALVLASAYALKSAGFLASLSLGVALALGEWIWTALL